MDKTSSLTAPTWLTSKETARASDLARTPDEQLTLHYREHAEALYRYLAVAFRAEEDAEEVTQEAFLRLYEALCAGEQIGSARAWVFTVGRRLMLKRVKHGRVETMKRLQIVQFFSEATRGPLETPEDALIDESRAAAVKAAMDALPDPERACFFARADGLKLREIADKQGMDLRRVAEAIGRAIELLQRQLRD